MINIAVNKGYYFALCMKYKTVWWAQYQFDDFFQYVVQVMALEVGVDAVMINAC